MKMAMMYFIRMDDRRNMDLRSQYESIRIGSLSVVNPSLKSLVGLFGIKNLDPA